eukprot:368067-Amphidinium_carterae.1
MTLRNCVMTTCIFDYVAFKVPQTWFVLFFLYYVRNHDPPKGVVPNIWYFGWGLERSYVWKARSIVIAALAFLPKRRIITRHR